MATVLAFWFAICEVCRTSSTVVVVSLTAVADCVRPPIYWSLIVRQIEVDDR